MSSQLLLASNPSLRYACFHRYVYTLQVSVPPPLTVTTATTTFATYTTTTSSTAKSPHHEAMLRASGQGAGVVMATVVQSTSKSMKLIPEGTAAKSMPSIISASHPLFVEEKKSHGERLVVGSSRGDSKLEKPSPLRSNEKDGSGENRDAKAGGNVLDKGVTAKINKASSADRSPSVPSSELEGFDDASVSAVFVDANYHVMFKEYNLRRSRSLTNSPRPVGKNKLKPDSSCKSTGTAPDKRLRSDDLVGDESAAKKVKIEDSQTVVVNIEPQKEREEEGEKEKEPSASSTKSSPTKRKPSLSQSVRSRKKQKVGATKKTEASDGGVVVCALCLRRDSESNLGFLYGPYKPQVDERELRWKVDSENHGGGGGGDGGGGGGENKVSSLWVHEDCAVWAPGVCLVGGKLLGLHDAVADGVNLVR